jgi:hypothetical protein
MQESREVSTLDTQFTKSAFTAPSLFTSCEYQTRTFRPTVPATLCLGSFRLPVIEGTCAQLYNYS